MTPASATPRKEPDVVVVGAGIIGLAVARELLARQPDRTVTVLEREPDVGFHQTGHNSGVLHAGIYYAPGSLKARLSTEGARELYDYCEARGLPARRDGKLIVAVSEAERPKLDELERRGTANGVDGLRRVPAGEIAEIEPHVRGVEALHSPQTAVVDFQAIARAFADDVRAAGGEVVTGCGVEQVEPAAEPHPPAPRAGRVAGALRGLLRRRLVGPARGRRRRRSPTRASSPSAAPGCACAPSAATS